MNRPVIPATVTWPVFLSGVMQKPSARPLRKLCGGSHHVGVARFRDDPCAPQSDRAGVAREIEQTTLFRLRRLDLRLQAEPSTLPDVCTRSRMSLTITAVHTPATDLGFLLHKSPRFHSEELSFGRAGLSRNRARFECIEWNATHSCHVNPYEETHQPSR